MIFLNFICMESHCMYSFVCVFFEYIVLMTAYYSFVLLYYNLFSLFIWWCIFPQFFTFIKNTVISMQQINLFPLKINPLMWKLLRLLTNITKLPFRKVTSILHSHHSIEDFQFLWCGPKLNTKAQVRSN